MGIKGEVKYTGNEPIKGSEFAAGSDLVSVDGIIIGQGETVLVGTGTSVEIPEGFFGLLVPRSSLAIKKGLVMVNGVGIIDSDYRGEIKVALKGQWAGAVLEAGERIAQLVIVPYVQVQWVGGLLSSSERGEGGFGSTGGYSS